MTELTEAETRRQQEEVCRRFGVEPVAAPGGLKVGVSRNVREKFPIRGMRCLPEGDTTGWYMYADPRSDAPDFFLPLHVEHLSAWCPIVVPYLLLPPGWRFTLAPGFEDVWFDEEFARHQGIIQ